MNFLPLKEEEIQLASLISEGVYDYQVIKSEDKISQAGNEYISLILRIYDQDGREHPVYTNLAMIKLIKHFCDVNGLEQDYDSGNVPAEKCLYKSSGKVVIGIEGEKPNGKGGTYRAKNIVKDYIVSPPGSPARPLLQDNNTFDQDVPF